MRQNKRFMLTALLALVAIMALCFTLAACNAKEYSVNLQFEESQGNVELSPATENGKYKEGTELTVTVTPKTGYVLDEFKLSTDSNAALNSNGKFVFTVSQDTTINVTFKPEPKQKYTLTVPTVENGEIKVSPTSPDNKYDEGTQITITLEPAVGYEVSEFTVDSVDKKSELQDNVYSFSIEKETSINASFSKKQYNVTTEVKGVSEKGSISLSPQKSTYEYGDQVTVTVTTQDKHGITPNSFTVSTDEEAVLSDGSYTLTVSGETQISVTIHACEYTRYEMKQGDSTMHTAYCDICDAFLSEKHTSMYKVTVEGDQEKIECPLCHYSWNRTHSLHWVDDGNGQCHQECTNRNPVCNYKSESQDHEMDWHKLDNESEGHGGSCKHNCGYTVEKEEHDKLGEGGACSKCGYVDASEHVCIEHVVADTNGFYDGECQICHQNAIFSIDSDGQITEFKDYATLKDHEGNLKIKVPATINGKAVKSIIGGTGKSLFSNNKDITDVVIAENAELKTLSSYLFENCTNLKHIVVCADIETIDSMACNGCSSLEYIVLPGTVKTVKGRTFGIRGVASLTTVYWGGTKDTLNALTNFNKGSADVKGSGEWTWTDDTHDVPKANN